MSDDLTLVVAGKELSGWTDIRVTRRIEACPNDFELGFTERYPGEADAFVVQAGDACTVRLGEDRVITGYVDRFARGYNASGHTLTLTGRGKTADLVDCMAEWPGGQISGDNVLQIATKLALPYKDGAAGPITVTNTGDAGPKIPQFNLTIGETAFDIIERICRYAGLLAYEGTDGNLILATGGPEKAASGFSEGVNVQSAHVVDAMDQRFSAYLVYLLATDVVADAGQGGNLAFTAYDRNVKRHRLTGLIAEAGGGGEEITERRALWEAARRIARGRQVTVICDSWRDSAGALWAPNTLAPVSLPGLKLDVAGWTIGEVTWRRDDKGTTAEITLMDAPAFAPEPIQLQPDNPDVKPPPAT